MVYVANQPVCVRECLPINNTIKQAVSTTKLFSTKPTIFKTPTMGNLLSDPPQPLPSPRKTYSPIKDENRDEIKWKVSEIFTEYSRLFPTGAAVARLTAFPADILSYLTLLKTLIDTLKSGESVDIACEMKNIAKAEIAKNEMARAKAIVNTIYSQLGEMRPDAPLDIQTRRNAAQIALNSCQELLNLFDEPGFIFWEISVLSSTILLPFSLLAVEIMKFCHQNNLATVGRLAILKAQLVCILQDYKKQCVLERLSYAFAEADWIDRLMQRQEGYSLGHGKFLEYHADQHDWYCCDEWEGGDRQKGGKSKHTYDQARDYALVLKRLYEEDFNRTIENVAAQLAEIGPMEVPRPNKTYCVQTELRRSAPLGDPYPD